MQVAQLQSELEAAAGARAQLQEAVAGCQEEARALRRELADAEASVARWGGRL
jgi:predicted  nucleic acid-binding Zn-ribbon protein